MCLCVIASECGGIGTEEHASWFVMLPTPWITRVTGTIAGRWQQCLDLNVLALSVSTSRAEFVISKRFAHLYQTHEQSVLPKQIGT
jgi:hypothetical protein